MLDQVNGLTQAQAGGDAGDTRNGAAADQQSPACPGDICPGLGNAFYLPNQNSMSINTGGAVFFADRKLGSCAVLSLATQGGRDFKTADTMDQFIDNTMAEANISGSYTSARLSVKGTAQAMTGSSTDITTKFHSAYMDISSIKSTVDFKQDSQCFTAKNLDGDFQKRFEALAPIDPRTAGSAAQWSPYVNFLQSVGSHIMIQQQVGSRFQQWESSTSEASDIATTLKIKACAEVEGTAGTGGWSVNSCGSYTSDEKNTALKTTTSTKRVILGGTDAARSDLINEVNAANLTKFIDGASAGSGAVRFLFKPIWDLLYGIYQTDCTAKGLPACANMQRALNLQAAYEGWTAIGCPQQGEYQYMATDSTDQYGINTWRCVVAKTGCRNDDSCHLGGAGSVCYCYGPNCIDTGDAVPSRSGSTFRDKIRGSQQGSYSDGVNAACYYVFPGHCDCNANWAGGLADRNIYQQSVPSELRALRASR